MKKYICIVTIFWVGMMCGSCQRESTGQAVEHRELSAIVLPEEYLFIGESTQAVWYNRVFPDSYRIFTLDTEAFSDLIDRENIQLVDVRTPAEHRAVTIPNAILIDVKDSVLFLQRADSLLNRDIPVAVFCKGGVRSKKAGRLLLNSFYRVYNLQKGFDDWQSAGKPVVSQK